MPAQPRQRAKTYSCEMVWCDLAISLMRVPLVVCFNVQRSAAMRAAPIGINAWARISRRVGTLAPNGVNLIRMLRRAENGERNASAGRLAVHLFALPLSRHDKDLDWDWDWDGGLGLTANCNSSRSSSSCLCHSPVAFECCDCGWRHNYTAFKCTQCKCWRPVGVPQQLATGNWL